MGKILGKDWVNQFAALEWSQNWNKFEIPALIETRFTKDNIAVLSTVMGSIWFDLNDSESIDAFEIQMTEAIHLLKNARLEWLKKKKDANLQA